MRGIIFAVVVGLVSVDAIGHQIYRCEIYGAVHYQSRPCPQDVQGRPVEERISVVQANRVPVRVDAPTPRTLQRVRQRSSSATSSREVDPARCAWLRREVARVDSMARQRSTQSLTDRRRRAVDEMGQLRCSRMN